MTKSTSNRSLDGIPRARATPQWRRARKPINGHGVPPPSYDTGLGSSIGYQVRKTHRMTESFMQSKLLRNQIPIGMWYFLRTLWIEDGITQRELSVRAGATEPTTLEQLRKMEKRGLVERRRDDRDLRKTIVLLTPQGRSLKRQLLRYIGELNDVAFRGFTRQEAELLKELLHRVRENLHAAKKKN